MHGVYSSLRSSKFRSALVATVASAQKMCNVQSQHPHMRNVKQWSAIGIKDSDRTDPSL